MLFVFNDLYFESGLVNKTSSDYFHRARHSLNLHPSEIIKLEIFILIDTFSIVSTPNVHLYYINYLYIILFMIMSIQLSGKKNSYKS